MKSFSLTTFAAGFVAGSVLLGGATVAYAAFVKLSDEKIGVLPNSSVRVYCVTKDSVARPYTGQQSTWSGKLDGNRSPSAIFVVSCPS
jgi:hypothetical protein